MAVTSGFFNSVSGDRVYNAEEMTTYFDGLVSDGVYESVGDAMIVRDEDGMNVSVGTGRALVLLHWIKNDTEYPLTIAAADVQYNRYDLIILKCDLSESARAITIEVKKGTPAENPAYPELTSTDTIKEMPLAAVRVTKNATAIYQSDITDLRGSSQCPWVTGIVKQVDTSQLYLQYQDAYERYYNQSTAEFNNYFAAKKQEINTWFENLEATLQVNTKLVKYQSSQKIEETTPYVYVLIDEYEAGDVLLVHVNGAMFIENTEYRVSGTGTAARITFLKNIRVGDVVTAICIKSVLGTA
jgi:hypothetical protein